MKLLVFLLLAIAATIGKPAFADEEISLFNNDGNAIAYIAPEEELTIYLWNGKPTAYLEPSDPGEFHVYGFNGEHLGWFLKGAIWGHDGKAACAIDTVIGNTKYEPFKSFKQFQPFKSFQKFAPYKPHLSEAFGPISCSLLLNQGRD